MIRPSLMRLTGSVALAWALSGCGGGGGINMTPPPVAEVPPPPLPPAPAPTPAPAPAPPPARSPYDTGEYRATIGAVSMNALAAYNRAATGAGIGIGVIDTGIDQNSAEFTGRISSDSQSVAGNASIADEGGHGTAVAFTAAGRRNGAGTQGVAFDATLVVLRADRPGTCADTPKDADESSCRIPTDAIARGIDVARGAGARVINISLGGAAAPSDLVAAVGRATAAGIVIVIAAGNDAADEPGPLAAVANDPTARNLVIIAGSVDANDAISSFSDRAGSGASHFLTAVGEGVLAPDQTGTRFIWSGTSFAAPQISGAVALLAQAFPNLSGAQIVSLLYQTTRDAGASGVDTVYGNGVIDLTRAFQPVGQTSVAGSRMVVSTTANGVLSAPMGDATTAGLGAVILDGYDRAFAIDLAKTLSRNRPSPVLLGQLRSEQRSLGMTVGGMTVSMTLAPRGDGSVKLQRTALGMTEARSAQMMAGSVTQRLGRDLSFGFGFAQGTNALTAKLSGQVEPAFLIANTAGNGFDSISRGSTAIRRMVGRTGITLATENGDILARRDGLQIGGRGWQRSGFTRSALSIDRRVGLIAARLTATRLDEADSVLGARFDPALGASRASSWFVDAQARFETGSGWTFGGGLHQGWTRAEVRGGLSGGGMIRSDAFAADFGKTGLFGRDSAGLRIAQPLRVARGGIDLALPTGVDALTARVDGWTTQRLNLAPQGREVDVEARYMRPLWLGNLQTNLYCRRDPGNIAASPNDYGLAMRYAVAF